MLRILNQYELDGYKVVEYTKDGVTVSHTVKTLIQTEPIEPVEPRSSIEELILAENLYQTALFEFQMIGGE
jgi:ribosomal protein S16